MAKLNTYLQTPIFDYLIKNTPISIQNAELIRPLVYELLILLKSL